MPQGNPHREALQQLVGWALRRYEAAGRHLRTNGGKHHEKWAAIVHEAASSLFVIQSLLEVADTAGDSPMPDLALQASPQAEALVAMEIENAELRQMLGSYRATVGVARGGSC